MTNGILLKMALVRNKMTVVALCKKCGFSTAHFYAALRGRNDFRAAEIRAICDCLNIENDEMNSIFFASNVADLATQGEE